MLPSKIKTVFWFLRRAELYPHFFRKVWELLIMGSEPDTSGEAVQWCESRAISTREALKIILNKDISTSVDELHRSEFARATQIEKSCPVWMGGPGDLNLLYFLARETGAKKAIETGVAYGWSSLTILLAMERDSASVLVSSDMPYVQGNNAKYVGCVVERPDLRKKWKLMRLPDRSALPEAIRELDQIDLCHYDSDKSYRGRMWAYPLLWDALRPGGVFISDDIGDNLAFRDFAGRLAADPLVVKVESGPYSKFVGVIRKPVA